MGYREQLRQARSILQEEIRDLEVALQQKAFDLRKLDSLLKDTGELRQAGPSLTAQIVETLYLLAQTSPEGVPARLVVQEFSRGREDVNESTIRSTLYQVVRKRRPTEIQVGNATQKVRVMKAGPLYDVELVAKQEAELI